MLLLATSLSAVGPPDFALNRSTPRLLLRVRLMPANFLHVPVVELTPVTLPFLASLVTCLEPTFFAEEVYLTFLETCDLLSDISRAEALFCLAA